MVAAYTRISTTKDTQKHDRQEKAITDYAKANDFTILEWYKDTISGKTKAENRPSYLHLKTRLKHGDILIVSDLDRLGRDASDTIIEVKDLQSRDIKLIALDIPYLNVWKNSEDDSIHKMIIDILITLKAHIAQQEREKIVARINQGLDVAKEKGIKIGRPNAVLPANFVKQYELFISGYYGKMNHTSFARMLGIGRTSLYKYIELYTQEKKAEKSDSS